VCITRGVRDHIRDRGEYEFEDLGEHSVKNIARSVRAFRIMFDPNATTELGEVAGAPEVSLSSEAVSNVPQDAIELEFWQSVQASGAVEEYSAYLDRYPDGIFAPLARDISPSLTPWSDLNLRRRALPSNSPSGTRSRRAGIRRCSRPALSSPPQGASRLWQRSA
jgi:hypothetical protein